MSLVISVDNTGLLADSHIQQRRLGRHETVFQTRAIAAFVAVIVSGKLVETLEYTVLEYLVLLAPAIWWLSLSAKRTILTSMLGQ